MRVHHILFLIALLIGRSASLAAPIECRGMITGPDGKSLPRADVVLLTPDRVTIVATQRAGTDGSFTLAVPSKGLWVVRCMGVGGRLMDVALYVPDTRPIRMTVSLPTHRYLAGDPAMQVIGDFNLWSIPKAIALRQTTNGLFEAELPATTDTVTIRLRGYRDDEGVEGITNASYVLNAQGLYDARLPVVNGKAHVQVDPRKLYRSETPGTITFVQGSPRTQRIAQAIHAWWSGEDDYFAHQNDHALERVPAGTPMPDWNAFVGGLVRQAEAEKDTLVRAFWDLGFVCTTMKSKSRTIEKFSRSLARMGATSIAWSYSPNTLCYAARNAKWEHTAIERYVKTAMDRHPDPVVRRRVLFNEFVIAFNADQDIKAAKYYTVLTTKYADTPEGRQTLKEYPREALEAPKK